MKTVMTITIMLLLVLVAIKVIALWLEQKMLYYPGRVLNATPENLGMAYEAVRITTQDGKQLQGWWIANTPQSYTVLFFHGNAGNISHRLHRINFFRDLGWNLLLMDYRGYGSSSGYPKEKGLYLDALAAYTYLTQNKGVASEQIIVYGKSLGGAVATELCLQKPAAALVLESTFTSTANVGRMMFPWLPVHWVISQKYDTLNKIAHLKLPKLIVHGLGDDIIPFSHAEQLYQQAVEPKQFLPFFGEHNDEVYVTSRDYQDLLKQFVLDQSKP